MYSNMELNLRMEIRDGTLNVNLSNLSNEELKEIEQANELIKKMPEQIAAQKKGQLFLQSGFIEEINRINLQEQRLEEENSLLEKEAADLTLKNIEFQKKYEQQKIEMNELTKKISEEFAAQKEGQLLSGTMEELYRLQLPEQPLKEENSLLKSTVVNTVLQQTAASITRSNSSATTSSGQMSPDTIKTKCQKFLSTLIRLAGDKTTKTASNVKKLIQNLIDGAIEPEEFSTQLEKELQSNHQPYLIHFLKKSLPHVRQALISGEMTIEGIRPPLVPASMQSLVPTTQMEKAEDLTLKNLELQEKHKQVEIEKKESKKKMSKEYFAFMCQLFSESGTTEELYRLQLQEQCLKEENSLLKKEAADLTLKNLALGKKYEQLEIEKNELIKKMSEEFSAQKNNQMFLDSGTIEEINRLKLQVQRLEEENSLLKMEKAEDSTLMNLEFRKKYEQLEIEMNELIEKMSEEFDAHKKGELFLESELTSGPIMSNGVNYGNSSTGFVFHSQASDFSSPLTHLNESVASLDPLTAMEKSLIHHEQQMGHPNLYDQTNSSLSHPSPANVPRTSTPHQNQPATPPSQSQSVMQYGPHTPGGGPPSNPPASLQSNANENGSQNTSHASSNGEHSSLSHAPDLDDLNFDLAAVINGEMQGQEGLNESLLHRQKCSLLAWKHYNPLFFLYFFVLIFSASYFAS